MREGKEEIQTNQSQFVQNRYRLNSDDDQERSMERQLIERFPYWTRPNQRYDRIEIQSN